MKLFPLNMLHSGGVKCEDRLGESLPFNEPPIAVSVSGPYFTVAPERKEAVGPSWGRPKRRTSVRLSPKLCLTPVMPTGNTERGLLFFLRGCVSTSLILPILGYSAWQPLHE